MSLLDAEQSDQPKSSRNIAVIGSTGRTGRLVLNEGVLRGHSMTAFTRRPDTLAEVNGLKSVVRGDGRNLEDMRRAMRGQDAVISIVVSKGRGPTTVMSDVTRAELDAMREAGVRRLVDGGLPRLERLPLVDDGPGLVELRPELLGPRVRSQGGNGLVALARQPAIEGEAAGGSRDPGCQALHEADATLAAASCLAIAPSVPERRQQARPIQTVGRRSSGR